jgi:hypothetical protein
MPPAALAAYLNPALQRTKGASAFVSGRRFIAAPFAAEFSRYIFLKKGGLCMKRLQCL